MPTESEQRAKLAATLASITSLDLESLARREDLGTDFCFDDVLPDLRREVDLFRDLHNTNTDRFPITRLNELVSQADTMLNLVRDIKAFSIKGQPEPEKRRESLCTRIRSQYQHFFNEVYPYLSPAVLLKHELDVMKADTAKALSATQDRHLTRLQEMETQASQAMEAIRKVSAQTGLSAHATRFRDQATIHRKAAAGWLVTAVLIGVLTLVGAGWNLWWVEKNRQQDALVAAAQRATSAQTQQKEPEQLIGPAIEHSVARLLMLSVLSVGLVMTIKNYRAHRHNAVVNEHRQNALSTFETFVNATQDPQTRNAVLLRATESIFVPVATGYLTAEPDAGGSLQVLEIMRGLGKDTMSDK